jgi:hypothetical protein
VPELLQLGVERLQVEEQRLVGGVGLQSHGVSVLMVIGV